MTNILSRLGYRPAVSDTSSSEPQAVEPGPVSMGQLVTLVIVLGASLFLRLGMVDMVEGTIPIRNDAKEYYSYAVNMKHSGVYSSAAPAELTGAGQTLSPDARRPPGYAIFLYPFVTAPPTLEMVYSIRVAQVVLSVLTVLLSFMVFRYFLSAGWSLLGTLLVGISPHLVAMNIYLLTEAVFTFFLMLFAYLAIEAFRGQSTLVAIFAGVCLGVTLLIKSSMLYFPYLLLLIIVLKFRSTVNYRVLILLCLGFLVIQSPWMIRNAGTELANAGKSKALVSLQNGSYPGLMYNDNPLTRGIPHRADPDYDDIKDYGDFLRDLSGKVSDEPWKYISWYVLGKLQMMLSWDMVAGAGDILVYAVDYSPYDDRQPFVVIHSIMKTLHPVLMVFAVLGMILAVYRGRGSDIREGGTVSLLVCGSIALYFVALHLLVTPLPRYMIPLRPVLYGLALYFVSYFAMQVRDRYSPYAHK